jgi:hypothetical protein
MTQNYNSMSVDWSPVSSIVFTSTYLPIVPEERIPTANVIDGTTNSSNDVEQQITDIVLSVDNPNDYNNSITLVSTTDYRRISLTSKEIREIDLKVYWRSKTGQLNPVMLSDGNSCSMKLKFEKRK